MELDLEIAAKHLFDDTRLVGAQHTVIHKNTGQLIADGIVDECRRHTGIHATA